MMVLPTTYWGPREWFRCALGTDQLRIEVFDSFPKQTLRNRCLILSPIGEEIMLTVPVKNEGKRDGTEVVQVYLRDLSDAEGPLKSLRAFQRVEVKAGQTVNAKLELTPKAFEFFDPETNTVHQKQGDFEVLYGNSSQDKDLKKLMLTVK